MDLFLIKLSIGIYYIIYHNNKMNVFKRPIQSLKDYLISKMDEYFPKKFDVLRR